MRFFARIVCSFLIVALILGPLSARFHLVCTASAATAAKPCHCEICDDVHKASPGCPHAIKFGPSAVDAATLAPATATILPGASDLLAIPQSRLPVTLDNPPDPPPPR